ncbi:MAG: ribokinase [Planctomycetota bacterium]
MPTSHGRVIVVGSTNTDLVVHCEALPEGGETVLGGDLLTFAGGKGANQAVAAARAGAKVHFIGAFGDDAFGRARRADLEKEGVDCSGCVTKKGVPSGVALIAIGSGGKGKRKAKAENQIVVAPGANMRLTPADVKRGLPKNLTIQDALVCSLEVPFDAIAVALAAARTAHCSTILNPAPMPPKGLPDALLRHPHFLTPNESECAGILGLPHGSPAIPTRGPAKLKSIAQRFQTLGYPMLLITCGARGVDLCDGDHYAKNFSRAPKVQAVDTVGAGDCFNGCLAAHLSFDDHADVNRAVDFAVAAAALKVTRHGAQAGMPRRAEILRMLKRMK